MKSHSILNSTLFKSIVFIMAVCYVISPLRITVFKVLHEVSHTVQDTWASVQVHGHSGHHHHHTTHEHDVDGHHHMTKSKPVVADHSHTATNKMISDHSHEVLDVLDLILSASEDDKDHQKKQLKIELDKHFRVSEYNIDRDEFQIHATKRWFTFVLTYNFYLDTLSPPPQVIS
ncbi:hypothetical protein F6U93_09035 [Tamlana haliotis]|uniref:Uncharacterized protein n=1 Tax=Pseudotamlana haliotis TaxID=2614804 RepID=A0A6N6MFM0_9FLAO|nr:hypothetical protein [Tamlana haliotis]KAB1067739.1 hypothetical protein F6U93_09035 [Tamlana haliotis]